MGNWLDNKTIVLTGASSGIGKEMTKLFIEKYNCNIIGIGRNKQKMKQLIEQLGDKSKNFSYQLFDVSIESNWADFSSYITKKKINIDIMINNAGVLQQFDKASNLKVEDYRNAMDTNYYSVVYSTIYVLPLMKQTNIVNICSSAGLAAIPGVTAYTASKFAVRGLTESLQFEVGHNCYVSLVCPGFTKSDIFRNQEIQQPSKLVNVISMNTISMAKKIVQGISKQKRRMVFGIDAKYMDFKARTQTKCYGRAIRRIMIASKEKLFDKVFDFSVIAQKEEEQQKKLAEQKEAERNEKLLLEEKRRQEQEQIKLELEKQRQLQEQQALFEREQENKKREQEKFEFEKKREIALMELKARQERINELKSQNKEDKTSLRQWQKENKSMAKKEKVQIKQAQQNFDNYLLDEPKQEVKVDEKEIRRKKKIDQKEKQRLAKIEEIKNANQIKEQKRAEERRLKDLQKYEAEKEQQRLLEEKRKQNNDAKSKGKIKDKKTNSLLNANIENDNTSKIENVNFDRTLDTKETMVDNNTTATKSKRGRKPKNVNKDTLNQSANEASNNNIKNNNSANAEQVVDKKVEVVDKNKNKISIIEEKEQSITNVVDKPKRKRKAKEYIELVYVTTDEKLERISNKQSLDEKINSIIDKKIDGNKSIKEGKQNSGKAKEDTFIINSQSKNTKEKIVDNSKTQTNEPKKRGRKKKVVVDNGVNDVIQPNAANDKKSRTFKQVEDKQNVEIGKDVVKVLKGVGRPKKVKATNNEDTEIVNKDNIKENTNATIKTSKKEVDLRVVNENKKQSESLKLKTSENKLENLLQRAKQLNVESKDTAKSEIKSTTKAKKNTKKQDQKQLDSDNNKGVDDKNKEKNTKSLLDSINKLSRLK